METGRPRLVAVSSATLVLGGRRPTAIRRRLLQQTWPTLPSTIAARQASEIAATASSANTLQSGLSQTKIEASTLGPSRPEVGPTLSHSDASFFVARLATYPAF